MSKASEIFGGGGGGIKSVQRGSASLPSSTSTVTITISAVDTSKTVVTNLGASAFNAFQMNYRLELTSATTVTVYRVNASNAQTLSWEVIEFE